MNEFQITVIGLGYIGLPTAALLASAGHKVSGVDNSQKVVNSINEGVAHIFEPGLDKLVSETVKNQNFRASLTAPEADFFFICVPTPLGEVSGVKKPDTSIVFNAIESIIEVLRPGNTIILESTSPIGTTAKIAKFLADRNINIDEINFAYCPERVLPGDIIHELTHNDRVIGGLDHDANCRVLDLYRTFVNGELLTTTAETAEMCKLVENSFRDVNIAFANELSMIAPNVEVDVREVIKLANRHPRVNILDPGIGVGGHCIAVDPWFLIDSDPDNTPLLRQARLRNERKTDWIIEQLQNRIEDGNFETLIFYGVTYKKNIDDMRESPALAITKHFNSVDKEVIIVEPFLKDDTFANQMPLNEAKLLSGLHIFLVAHDQFRIIFDELKQVGDSSRHVVDVTGNFA